MKYICIATIFTLTLTFISACSKDGPMEDAGERVDEIVDNVKEGENPLRRKGAMEKAGEAIDDTVNGK